MNTATKVWQKVDEFSGQTVTISIWPDKKVRTGYYTKDLWDTLHRSTVPSLTDEEWYAAPGPEWKDITT